jgi:ribosomal protein L37E
MTAAIGVYRNPTGAGACRRCGHRVARRLTVGVPLVANWLVLALSCARCGDVTAAGERLDPAMKPAAGIG